MIERLRAGQDNLRDQIAMQLLGMVAFRKNEARILQLKDFDLARGNVTIHGKGGKVRVMPLGFSDLKRDLEIYLVGRDPEECFLYPKRDTSRPMTPPSVHRWFKRCLAKAGLPTSIKMHELRHSPETTSGGNRQRGAGAAAAPSRVAAMEVVRSENEGTA